MIDIKFTESWQKSLQFFRLGRPHFLAGGFLLHGLGVVMALFSGARLNLLVLLWGQVAITAIQLMTHYSNDYYDLPADRANQNPTSWAGGSRVLVEGIIQPRIALVTAVVFGCLALTASLILAFFFPTGPLTFPLLLLALTLAWSYSSPPLQLNWHGLGEITGACLITGLTPIVGYYLQADRLTELPFLAAFPIACLQFAMLMVINYPDADGDRAANKHTLIYFLGKERAAQMYLAVLLLAYGSLPILAWLGLPALVALALLAISPLAFWQGWRMKSGAWAQADQWNSLGFWSIGLLMGSITAEFVCFLFLFMTSIQAIPIISEIHS